MCLLKMRNKCISSTHLPHLHTKIKVNILPYQTKTGSTVSYIEVARTRRRELNGLVAAIKETKCKNLLLITDHERDDIVEMGYFRRNYFPVFSFRLIYFDKFVFTKPCATISIIIITCKHINT